MMVLDVHEIELGGALRYMHWQPRDKELPVAAVWGVINNVEADLGNDGNNVEIQTGT